MARRGETVEGLAQRSRAGRIMMMGTDGIVRDQAGNPLGTLNLVRNVFSWYDLPHPRELIGQEVLVNDFGVGAGSKWVSDGTAYFPMHPIVFLREHTSQDALQSDGTNGQAGRFIQQVNYTFPGPSAWGGNSPLGMNGEIWLRPTWTFLGAATASKTLSVNFGTLSLYSAALTTVLCASPRIEFANRSKADSQIVPVRNFASHGVTTGTGNSASGTMNTTLPQTISMGVSWGVVDTAGTGNARLTNCLGILF